MKNITRNNHYVPQAYLRQWEHKNSYIWCYNVLVPNEKFPFWKQQNIKNIAYIRDLYSTYLDGKINDEYEYFLKKEYEDPFFLVVRKISDSEVLNKKDIEVLVKYLLLQDIRTPSAYFDAKEVWEKSFPKIATEVLDSIEEKIRSREKIANVSIDEESRLLIDCIQTSTDLISMENQTYLKLQISSCFNTRQWINQQKYLLLKMTNTMLSHNWLVIKAPENINWYTSDHPVVRLNYFHRNAWNMNGGLGSINTNIIMPLTPKYLLFTQIGNKQDLSNIMTDDLALELNDIIVNRACRYVFSIRPMNRIKHVKKRLVDEKIYLEEKKYWESVSKEGAT